MYVDLIFDEEWLVLRQPKGRAMMVYAADTVPPDFEHVPHTFRSRLRKELRHRPFFSGATISAALLVVLSGEWAAVAIWLWNAPLVYLLVLAGLPGALAAGLSFLWSGPQAACFLLASAAHASSVSHGYAALLLLVPPPPKEQEEEENCLVDSSFRCACGLIIASLEVGDVLRASLAEGGGGRRSAWLEPGGREVLVRGITAIRHAASHVAATLAWLWVAAQLHKAICGRDPFLRAFSAKAWSQDPELVLCLHGLSMACREGRRALFKAMVGHLRSKHDPRRLFVFAQACLRRRGAEALLRVVYFAKRSLPPRTALRALRIFRALGPPLLVPTAAAVLAGAALPASPLGEGLKLWGGCMVLRWTADLCFAALSREEGPFSDGLADAVDLLPGGWGLTETGRRYGKRAVGALDAILAIACRWQSIAAGNPWPRFAPFVVFRPIICLCLRAGALMPSMTLPERLLACCQAVRESSPHNLA